MKSWSMTPTPQQWFSFYITDAIRITCQTSFKRLNTSLFARSLLSGDMAMWKCVGYYYSCKLKQIPQSSIEGHYLLPAGSRNGENMLFQTFNCYFRSCFTLNPKIGLLKSAWIICCLITNLSAGPFQLVHLFILWFISYLCAVSSSI